MTDYSTVQAKLKARVMEVDSMARKLFPAYATCRLPTVSFSYTGTAAGIAQYGPWNIILNAGQAIQSDAIERLTVPHEVAHLVEKWVYKKSGHSKQWKMICRALGGDGKRCYNADERGVTIIRGRTSVEYLYKASCGAERWLGPVYHKKLQTRFGYVVIYRESRGRITKMDYLGQSRPRQ